MYQLPVLQVRLPKIKMLAGLFPVEVLGENLFPCIFGLLRDCLHSWLCGPFGHCPGQQVSIVKSLYLTSASVVTCPFLTLTHPPASLF